MACVYYKYLTRRLEQSISCFFFFQAEDGIRDLVRSRGLGDVYKRQPLFRTPLASDAARGGENLDQVKARRGTIALSHQPVSYTHLTLPTSDLV